MSIDPCDRLLHPALEPVGPAVVSRRALTDRERLAVLLQAGGLLSHLRLAGWHLTAGWRNARLDGDRLLRSVVAAPGRAGEWPQRALVDLAGRLFDAVDGEITGRGHARRIARELVADWRQGLVPLSPDEAVRQLLEAAPFLWQPPFAAARRALAAEHDREGRRRLWVAGPGHFRRRLTAGCAGLRAVCGRLESERARACWSDEPRRCGDVLGTARRLIADGRFESASRLLRTRVEPRAGVLRAACRARLGRLEAARRGLERIDAARLTATGLIELTETAVWLHGCLGRPAAARPWLRRALAVDQRAARERALLAAAGSAWDAADLDTMERHLAAARRARPDWRWRHLAGLAALGRRDHRGACEQFARALGDARRRLGRFDAAALWSDLGIARAAAGDLAAAERALLHSVRLHQRTEGPHRTTLALFNLAAVRLRRGRTEGVREILERSERADRAAGNRRALAYDRELLARYQLLRGRPRLALQLATEALGEPGRREIGSAADGLRVVRARALGWLGRAEAAAEALARVGTGWRGLVEPEEAPALLALAGDRGGARRAAGGTSCERLWRAVLAGGVPDERAWDAADALEPYRAARLVADLELVTPGVVTPDRLRGARSSLRRVGNRWLAARLDRALEGAWGALERYLRRGGRDREALATLFRECGYPEVSLIWRRSGTEQPVVAGRGGAEELCAACHGGELVLAAESLDGRLRALLALVARDWRPAARRTAPSAQGIVGRSPALLSAIERAERLARGDLPVLLLGETGTGKELVARHVHRRSPRRGGPLMPLNSAALSESLVLSELFGHARGAFTGADRDRPGIFEAARGGSVLLDEVGDLPRAAQGLLLRVLQEGEVRRLGETRVRSVDVRVIAATHRRLDRRVADGRFRADLYYRLAVGRVELPPLRERGEDLDLLIDHFLRRASPRRRLRLTAEARERLRAHDFPGNVRELANRLAAAAALAEDGVVRVRDLGLPRRAAGRADGYHQRLLDFRRRLVGDALRASGGNRAAAARRLGLSRQALSYLVRTLGLS